MLKIFQSHLRKFLSSIKAVFITENHLSEKRKIVTKLDGLDIVVKIYINGENIFMWSAVSKLRNNPGKSCQNQNNLLIYI